MIITYYPYGRLGNRLFQFAHLMAFGDRFSTDILNFAFQEYSSSFPFWARKRRCRYGEYQKDKSARISSLPIVKIAKFSGILPCVRFWDKQEIVFDGEGAGDPRVRKLIEVPVAIFEGWSFRSHDQITASMPNIRFVFQPGIADKNIVRRRMAEARKRGDKVLGVHIRWSDYRGSDWFFSLQEFNDSIASVRSSAGGDKLACVVSSSEKIGRSQLPPECILLEGNNPIADMYTLSECDYIMGPPSTFSGWASFFGGKPLLEMRDHGKRAEIDNARIVLW